MTISVTHDIGCRALEFEGPDPLCRKCDSVTHDPQRLERARELLERCYDQIGWIAMPERFEGPTESPNEVLNDVYSFLEEEA